MHLTTYDPSISQQRRLEPDMEIMAGPSQQRLYLYGKRHPQDPCYNLAFCFKIEGPLDWRRLKLAAEDVFDRTELLKVNFIERPDGVFQNYEAARDPRLEVIRLDDETPDEAEAEVMRRVRRCAVEPMDLARWPLMHATLFRVSPDVHYINFVIHHILADVYSFYQMADAVAEAYNSPAGRQAEHSYNYFDYLKEQAAERAKLASNPRVLAKKQELSGLSSLALEGLQEITTGLEGGSEVFDQIFGGEVARQIDACIDDNELTPFSFFLGVYAVLLSKITRQSRLVIGLPLANRTARTKSVFGLCANTLPLTIDIDPQDPFDQLVKRLNAKLFSLLRVQSCDLDDLVDPAALRGSRLFNNAFTFYKQPFCLPLDGCTVQSLPVLNHGHPAFPLTWVVQREESGYRVSAERQAGVLRHLDLGQVLPRLLSAVVTRPTAALNEIPLEDERTASRAAEAGRTELPVEGTIHALFARQAALYPERPALRLDGRSMTYEELNTRANQIAHLLSQERYRTLERVPLYLDRSFDLIAAVLGVLKANKTYVPIDVSCPASRVRYIIQDLQSPLLLTTSSHAAGVVENGVEPVCLDAKGSELRAMPTSDPDLAGNPDQDAYIIYTSGSTGNPKGVVITHRNVLRLFKAGDQGFQFGPADVWTMFHSPAFDFSVWEMYGALLYGGSLVIVPQRTCQSHKEFYELLLREKVTVLNQTPSSFKQLIPVDQACGQRGELSLRYIIFGGEALHFDMLAPWFENHPDDAPLLVNMYGITETTVHVTYFPVTREHVAARSGSVIGRPLCDLRLYLMDESLHMVPVGVPGEIVVGGAGVSRGYLNQPELTGRKFVASPFSSEMLYRSGDLARYLPDGSIEYLGRIDKQVKIRGYRIELGEIEAAIRASGHGTDCAVAPHEFTPGRERLVAYVVPLPGSTALDERALRDHLASRLPPYMVPARIIPIARLPLTTNGKIDYQALPDPAGQSRPRHHFRSEHEKRIAGVWQEVLQIEDFGREDKFFDIGGDSLDLGIVACRLKEELGVNLSVMELIEYPTISGLAGFLASRENPLLVQASGDRGRLRRAALAQRRRSA